MALSGMNPHRPKTRLHMLEQTTWFEKVCVPPERAVYIPCTPDEAGDLGSAAAHNHPLHTLAYPAVDLYWIQRQCEPLDRAIPRLDP